MATHRIITRTIYGSQLQTVRQLGLKHEVLEYTTINQALNEPTIIDMLPDPMTRGMEITEPYDYDNDTNSIFTQLLVCGNGGHKNINNPNDATPYTVPVPHLATDSGLFNLLPFLCRDVTDDLSVAERGLYALRRTLDINGVLKAFYFGRKLDFPRTTPDMNLVKVVDGVETIEQFIPTMSNLRPTQQEETADYDGSYVSVSSFLEVSWGAEQIEAMKEACRLLYGNERMTILSELAICSCVFKPVTQRYPTTGAQVPVSAPANTFFEAVATQVNVHITTYIPLSYVDQEYTLSLNLGATEPIFGPTVTT